MADGDGDDQVAFYEYAAGTFDNDSSSQSFPTAGVEPVDVGGVIDGYLILEFQVNLAAEGVTREIQSSTDLLGWLQADADFVRLSTANNGDGTATVRYRSVSPFDPSATREFFRIQVSG